MMLGALTWRVWPTVRDPKENLARSTGAEAAGRWYVVNTHATREHVVAAHLRRQSYAVFLPRT
jgi:hypothetical protein